MFSSVLRKVFGSRNDRLVKKLKKSVDAINGLEKEFEALSDEHCKPKPQNSNNVLRMVLPLMTW